MPPLRRTAFALALLLGAPGLHAQSIRWTLISEELTEPYEPCPPVLTRTPDGAWLAGTHGDGIYRAEPGASAWTDVLFGDLADVTVTGIAALTDSVLLASTSGGLYRSDDGGQTWAWVPGAPYVHLVGVAAVAGTAWITTYDVRVLRSTDGGVTWEEIADLDQGAYNFSALPSGTLFISRWNNMVRSEDGGATWAQVLSSPSRQPVVVGPGGAAYLGRGSVYRSDDDGRTWAPVPNSPGSSTSLAASSAGELYLGTYTIEGGIYKSTVFSSHDGVTWTPVFSTSGYNPACSTLPPAASGAPALLSLQSGGVLRSGDSGWTPMNAGFERRTTVLALAVAGDALLGFSPQGFAPMPRVYRTTDGGTTWDVREAAGFGYPDDVIVLADGRLLAAGGDVIGSTDGGGTWTPLFEPEGEGVRSVLEAANGTLLAGTSYGAIGLYGRIYRSADGGATWAQASHPSGWGWVTHLVQASDGALFAVHEAGFEGGHVGIVRSLDDGLTWTPVYSGDVSDLAVLPDGTLLTILRSYPEYEGLRSTDGGMTWNVVGPVPPEAGALYTVGGVIFATVSGAFGSLYATVDGGATWVEAREGMGNRSVYDVAQDAAGHVYATTYAGVFRTTEPVTVGAEATPAAGLALEPVQPNPAAGAATLAFTLEAPGEVELVVVDVLGRRVAVVARGVYPAGRHTVGWAAPGLAPGVYTAVLRAGGRTATTRFTLAR